MSAPGDASFANDMREGIPAADLARLEVERALRGSSHCGLRHVQCQYADGRVTLSGDVASYYLKQIAQTIVGRLEHVTCIDNQLRVVGIDRRRWDA